MSFLQRRYEVQFQNFYFFRNPNGHISVTETGFLSEGGGSPPRVGLGEGGGLW